MVLWNLTLMMFNNLASHLRRSSARKDAETLITINTPWTSVLTAIASQSPLATEVKSIPVPIATVSHALMLIRRSPRETILTTLMPILNTKFPTKSKKPSVIFSLTLLTDAFPAA